MFSFLSASIETGKFNLVCICQMLQTITVPPRSKWVATNDTIPIFLYPEA